MNQPKQAEATAPAAEETPAPVTETPETKEEQQAPVTEEAKSEETVKPEGETETEGEAEDALSKPNSSLTPELQAVVDKRIGKAVAKQRKAERDLAELKLRLAEIEAAPRETPKADSPSIVPLPQGAPTLANINTVAELQKLQSDAKQAIRFAEAALEEISDGAQPPEGWTKQALREVARNARVTLEDQIPERQRFLTTRHQMQQKAYEVLPFMKDRASTDYRAAQAIYERHPFLRNIPEGDFTVGLIVEGIKAVEARQNAAQAAAKPDPKKPVISKPKPTGGQSAVSAEGSSGRAPIGAAKEAALAEERKKLAAKGGASQQDYAASLFRRQQLRNSG